MNIKKEFFIEEIEIQKEITLKKKFIDYIIGFIF